MNTLKKSLTLCTFGIAALCANAQTSVTIKLKESGDERIFVVEDKGKLYFDNNENLLIDQYGTDVSATFALADIRKITFSNTTGLDETIAEIATPFVYPNPAKDIINFGNIEIGTIVSIYSPQGVCLLNCKYDGKSIDISSLSQGIYYIKTNYGQTFTLEIK